MGKTFFPPFTNYKIAGRRRLFLRPGRFNINKAIWYWNSWQPFAWGSLRPNGDGTELDVRIGLTRFEPTLVAIGLAIWAAFVGAVTWFVGPINMLHIFEIPVLWLLLAMIPIYLVVTSFIGRWVARNEPAFLHDFLKTTLLAEDQKAPPYPPAQAGDGNKVPYSR